LDRRRTAVAENIRLSSRLAARNSCPLDAERLRRRNARGFLGRKIRLISRRANDLPWTTRLERATSRVDRARQNLLCRYAVLFYTFN